MTSDNSSGHDSAREEEAPRSNDPFLAEFLEQLPAAAPPFEDESLAPEVDREVLLALVRRQLSREHARLVYRLIYSFQSWSDAHNEVLIEEFRDRSQ